MIASATVHAEPTQELDAAVYRVNFWELLGEAWALDAFVLTEVASVAEVLNWAEATAAGRRFEVFVELDAASEAVHEFHVPRKANLLRLAGENPNIGDW